jgi:hypothetical protein
MSSPDLSGYGLAGLDAATESGFAEPPMAGAELPTLLGSLERQRATFRWKASGLSASQMQVRVGASTMTLAGLVKHLALVEDNWFQWRLLGTMPEPWRTVDWEATPDWEWRTAAADTPEELFDLWSEAVARSRAAIGSAYREGGLGQPAATAWPDGSTPSLRRILIDIIEEYARHVGHADLIRESVDGLVGEDPPRP